ncbi:MAG: Fic family protein [Candidatus Bathyarchaeota archaeon]
MTLINKRIHERVLDKKKRLDSHRPISLSLVKRLKEQLVINYTYNSNAIEGNTLTLNETRLVIQEGITIGGKSITEVLEAKNHPEAINFIEDLVSEKREISEDNILGLHKLIMSNIIDDAGCYRTTGVTIGGAVFNPPPSSEVKPRIDELLEWLQRNPEEYTPIELAAVFHHLFVSTHPFIEGNGRTARLLMNVTLMKNGYPFIAIVSKNDRPKYLKTLMEADLGNSAPFVNFIARCVEKSLDVYLEALEEPQILSLSEAAKMTSYSQEYLSLLARKGSLGAHKQGRNWVISKKDLDRYLASVGKPASKTK